MANKRKGEKENPAKVGDKFITKNGVEVEIVIYNSYKDVWVSDGVLTKRADMRELRLGEAPWPNGPKLPRKKYAKSRIKPREDGLNNGLPKKYKTGAVFDSKNSGKFTITQVSSEGWLEVEFHNTKHKRIYKANYHFRANIVNDNSLRKKSPKPEYVRKTPLISERWPEGSVHASKNHGKFKIVKINGCLDIIIQWENTGHIQTTQSAVLRANSTKDESISGNYLGAKGYYVYYAKHEDKIVYVGIGKDARYSHCTSGKSTSYYLNKLHFDNQQVSVGILKDELSRDVAATLERYCILRILPAGNIAIPLQPIDEIRQGLDRTLVSFVENVIKEIHD